MLQAGIVASTGTPAYLKTLLQAITGVQQQLVSINQVTGGWQVICGGGDSALDWALNFVGKAESVILLHRREDFRAAPASVAKMKELCENFEMQFLVGQVTGLETKDDKLAAIYARRFSPEYRVAFDAWLKTEPFTKPDAPSGTSSSSVSPRARMTARGGLSRCCAWSFSQNRTGLRSSPRAIARRRGCARQPATISIV